MNTFISIGIVWGVFVAILAIFYRSSEVREDIPDWDGVDGQHYSPCVDHGDQQQGVRSLQRCCNGGWSDEREGERSGSDGFRTKTSPARSGNGVEQDYYGQDADCVEGEAPRNRIMAIIKHPVVGRNDKGECGLMFGVRWDGAGSQLFLPWDDLHDLLQKLDCSDVRHLDGEPCILETTGDAAGGKCHFLRMANIG